MSTERASARAWRPLTVAGLEVMKYKYLAARAKDVLSRVCQSRTPRASSVQTVQWVKWNTNIVTDTHDDGNPPSQARSKVIRATWF